MKALMLVALAHLSISTAQAVQPTGTLMLACEGTAIEKTQPDAQSNPISMGIIVDFAARTVAGFGYGGWDEVVNIISVGDVTIAFGGPSQRKDGAWLVLGTIDRITGSVDATASM